MTTRKVDETISMPQVPNRIFPIALTLFAGIWGARTIGRVRIRIGSVSLTRLQPD